MFPIACIVAAKGYLPSVDADAAAYFAAVDAAGGTLSAAEKAAHNDWVLTMKAASLYTMVRARWPFIGTSAVAHSFNCIDPAEYRATWQNAPTHNASGVTFNGTDEYGEMGITTTDMGLTGGFSLYINIMSTGDNRRVIGTVDGASQMRLNFDTNQFYANYGGDGFGLYVAATAPTAGLWSVHRSAADAARLDKNGASIDTDTSSVTVDLTPVEYFLGAQNNTGPTLFSNATVASLTFHDPLSEAQAASFYTIEQAFQTALGREV